VESSRLAEEEQKGIISPLRGQLFAGAEASGGVGGVSNCRCGSPRIFAWLSCLRDSVVTIVHVLIEAVERRICENGGSLQTG
jgi:hypothetical protein